MPGRRYHCRRCRIPLHVRGITQGPVGQSGLGAPREAFTFGLLYGLEQWHAAALEEEFRQLWEAQGKTLRRVLG